MGPGPLKSALLAELGFDAGDRAVIVHADDVGMCHSTLPALDELLDHGVLSSASAMVPCPWFPAVAERCRRDPAIDMGVHLTLTSEWSLYRWRPLSTADPASGLLDGEGYFPRTARAVAERAAPAAVAREIRAQLDTALAAGIDVTHLDSHMFALFQPALLPLLVRLATEYRLPMPLWVPAADSWLARAFGDVPGGFWAGCAEPGRLPLLERVEVLPLRDLAEPRRELAWRLLDGLPAGVSQLIIHPACDSPELRAMTAHWQARVADYEVFADPSLAERLRRRGIHLVGYRQLRETLRRGVAPLPATER
jgi:chitin disaccharide deacetylase